MATLNIAPASCNGQFCARRRAIEARRTQGDAKRSRAAHMPEALSIAHELIFIVAGEPVMYGAGRIDTAVKDDNASCISGDLDPRDAEPVPLGRWRLLPPPRTGWTTRPRVDEFGAGRLGEGADHGMGGL